MIGPPERNSPAWTAIQRPGGETGGGLLREVEYTASREKKTAACEAPQSREPRYEAGWMHNYDNLRHQGYAAFLRPYHEGWYDLFYVDSWMEAVAKALEITRQTPDCEYVGDGRMAA